MTPDPCWDAPTGTRTPNPRIKSRPKAILVFAKHALQSQIGGELDHDGGRVGEALERLDEQGRRDALDYAWGLIEALIMFGSRFGGVN